MLRGGFVRAWIGNLGCCLSIGIMITLRPSWIADVLRGSDTELGVAVFFFGLASICARPLCLAALRSIRAERLLMIAAVAAAASDAATPLIENIQWMWALRVLEGLAFGTFYTCMTTALVSSTAANRRGGMLSIFSLSLYLGIAVGPLLGEYLLARYSDAAVWCVCAGMNAFAVVVCNPVRAMFRTVARPARRVRPGRQLVTALAHPAARIPAMILGLTVIGWSGFQTFLPLYGPTIGMRDVGPVFLVYASIIVVVRLVGSREFDRIPLIETIVLGCGANGAALAMAAVWRSPVAIYIAGGLLAIAMALTYTTLLQVALEASSPGDHGGIVASYTLSYDLGAATGGLILGAVISWSGSYGVMFAAGAACGITSLVLTLGRYWRSRERYRPASA